MGSSSVLSRHVARVLVLTSLLTGAFVLAARTGSGLRGDGRLPMVLGAALVLAGGAAVVIALGLSLRRDRARLLTALSTEQRAREQLRQSSAFRDAVLAASPDLMYVIDLDTSTTRCISQPVAPALGSGHAEIDELGSAVFTTLLHPEDVGRVRRADIAATVLADGEVHALSYRVRYDDGRWRVFARRVTPFRRDTRGRVTQLLAVARDVTESADTEDKLRRAALHDPLTGLPNRAHLAQSLAQELARARNPVAVLFCDLDGFKRVNDTGGHTAGDQVLTMTAARLRAAVRPHDMVARFGGDEFVVILHPNPGRDPRTDALKVAERITRVVAQPVVVGSTAYTVSVSTGITVAGPGDDPGATLRTADAAMYRAKALGKNRAHESA